MKPCLARVAVITLLGLFLSVAGAFAEKCLHYTDIWKEKNRDTLQKHLSFTEFKKLAKSRYSLENLASLYRRGPTRFNKMFGILSQKEGAYIAERFTIRENGRTRPYQIFSLSSKGNEKIDFDSFLKRMRRKIPLTDRQIARRGVQFAIKNASQCRTLAYAINDEGEVGATFSDTFGNYSTRKEMVSRISEYGSSLALPSTHSLDFTSHGMTTVKIAIPENSVGLLSASESDRILTYRDADFKLYELSFASTGSPRKTFRQTAEDCTKRFGLAPFKEYLEKGHGRFPLTLDSVRSCMVKSGYISTKPMAVLRPFELRVEIDYLKKPGQASEDRPSLPKEAWIQGSSAVLYPSSLQIETRQDPILAASRIRDCFEENFGDTELALICMEKGGDFRIKRVKPYPAGPHGRGGERVVSQQEI